MELDLPAPFVARSYRGRADHPVMAETLGLYRLHQHRTDIPTAADLDATYGNLYHTAIRRQTSPCSRRRAAHSLANPRSVLKALIIDCARPAIKAAL